MSLTARRLRSLAARTRTGFTLPEVVVALTLVGVTFVVMQTAVTSAVRQTARSAVMVRATTAAQRHAERLFAGACVASAGTESDDAISLAWTATPIAGMLDVHQVVQARYGADSLVTTYQIRGRCG